MKSTRIIILSFILAFSLPLFASSKKDSAQIINFYGIDVNSSKGSPRDAYVSTKKKANFDYFFNTNLSFKKKIKESLEGVR